MWLPEYTNAPSIHQRTLAYSVQSKRVSGYSERQTGSVFWELAHGLLTVYGEIGESTRSTLINYHSLTSAGVQQTCTATWPTAFTNTTSRVQRPPTYWPPEYSEWVLQCNWQHSLILPPECSLRQCIQQTRTATWPTAFTNAISSVQRPPAY